MTEHERALYEATQDENARKSVLFRTAESMMPLMFGDGSWTLKANVNADGKLMPASKTISSAGVYADGRLCEWQSLKGDSPAQMVIDIFAAVDRAIK